MFEAWNQKKGRKGEKMFRFKGKDEGSRQGAGPAVVVPAFYILP